MSETSEESKRGARSLSWQKKLTFTCVTTGSFFLLLEGTLALVGVNPVTQTGDPLIGFSSQVPLMEAASNDAGESVLRTAPGKLIWFNQQSFLAKKRANTQRIFCVGGSTTYGRPFADLTSYSGWLRELLPVVDKSTKWEIVNTGGVSYASYRVATVMEELAQYEPDLFIVYCAHNEFLERRTYEGMFDRSSIARDIDAALQKTRTWSLVRHSLLRSESESKSSIELLPAEVDEMLNHSIGPLDYHADDDWHDKVLQHYEMNLERMVSIARDAGAAIIFVTPASNLRDCSPFKSETSIELSEDQASKVTQFVDRAKQNLIDKRFDAAVTSCRAALAIDAAHAEAHYQAGRALFQLGRYDEAEDAFKHAIDDDICPLRAISSISNALRRVASSKQVPLADFQNLLRDKCQTEFGHGCIGGEYFLDHVHPTIDIHRQLALWILAKLQSQAFVGGSAPSDTEMDLIRRDIEEQIDIDVQGIALRNLAKVLHWSGKFSEAAPRARDAIELVPRDLESHFILADCLFNMNRVDEAFAQYELLLLVGDFPRAYLPYGEMLADRDRLRESKGYLLQAVLACRDSNRPRAFYALGSVHYRLGEMDLAIQSLEETDRLYPDDPGTLTLLAEAYVDNGDIAKGIDTLRRVIAIAPSDYTTQYRLGMVLLGESQIEEARRQFEIAIKIDPQDDRAIQALETVRQLER